MYYSDFHYAKATECFQKAISLSVDLDPTRYIQLLSYFSIIQAQMRDFPNFVESKARILTLRQPNKEDPEELHLHHIASAICQHLNTDCSKAIDVLEGYGKLLAGDRSSQHEEVFLYEIFLMEESGHFEEALVKLLDKEPIIVNKLALKERQASLLVKLDRMNDAKKIYRELLFHDPENSSYHCGIQKCVVSSENGQHTSADVQELKDLYKSLEEEHSSSTAVKRILLDFLQGDELENATSVYLRHLLKESVPSLHPRLCSLYQHQYPDKVDITGQVILELESSLRENSEPIRKLLWTLFLLFQRYDKHGHYGIALAMAIHRNPEVAQFYLAKKIKHPGALKQQDSSRDMWYELASGHSYFQQGDIGPALKNYLAIVNYYMEMTEHLFDYHFDKSREMAPHTYVETLRHQERLDPGSYFHKATEGVVRCYMKLHDKTLKLLPVEKMMQGAGTSRIPDSEKMQDDNQPKKKPQKSHAKDMSGKKGKKTRASTSGEQQHSNLSASDLLAVELCQVENPLLEAARYLNLLQNSFPDSFRTYILLFELHMRNQKIVDAYHVLKKILSFDENDPDTLRCSVRFYGRLSSMDLNESVRSKLSDPLSILDEGSLIETVKKFLERNKDSLFHVVAAAEMLFFLQPYTKLEIMELLKQTIMLGQDNKKLWKLNDCIAAHRLLKSVLGDAETASVLAHECSQLFPLSRYFFATKPVENDTPVKNECREVWIFDSGCGHHVTTDVNLLSKKYRQPGSLNVSSGNEVPYQDVGLASIECGVYGNFLLREVPDYAAHKKIVSIPRFTKDNACVVQMFHDGFLLRDENFIDQVPQEFILATGQIAKMSYMFMSDWKLDSGANNHCTSNESLLDSDTLHGCVTRLVRSADGSTREVSKVGSRQLTFTSKEGMTRTFMLSKVYVFSEKCRTVISISAFAKDNNCSFIFTSDYYYILDAKFGRFFKPELIRGYGVKHRGHYYSS